jgi:cytoskeletal protein CcmA (bactofilin family)
MRAPIWVVCMLLALLAPDGAPRAQEAGASVVKRGSFAADLYAAGGSVDVRADVDGDVVVAGGRIDIDGRVTGDVLAAGGSVVVRGEVLDDARVAGGEVMIFGHIADDAVLVGGTVTIAQDASVGHRAWLAGGHVEVAGRVGELRAGAGRVVISGEVRGDATVRAEAVEVRPGAMILGRLTAHSPEPPDIHPTAHIEGPLVHEPMHAPRAFRPVHFTGALVLLVASLGLTGTVLYLLFPRLSVRAARNVGYAPAKSLGLGLGTLAATPLAAVLLMLTALGFWLALVLLALYLLALLFGFLTGTFFLGDAGLRFATRGHGLSRPLHVVAFVLALAVVALIALIPQLGGLLAFLLLLFGLGALVLELYRSYATASA